MPPVLCYCRQQNPQETAAEDYLSNLKNQQIISALRTAERVISSLPSGLWEGLEEIRAAIKKLES